MSLFPRFLYFFRTLPFHVPQSLVKQSNSLITKFIWRVKSARIKLKVLCLSPCEGGHGLPDLYLYNLAAQSMVIWALQTNRLNPPSWLWIEQHQQLADINISSFSYIIFVHTFNISLNNPFLLQGCKIWLSNRKKTKNLQMILWPPCSTLTRFYPRFKRMNPACYGIVKVFRHLVTYLKMGCSYPLNSYGQNSTWIPSISLSIYKLEIILEFSKEVNYCLYTLWKLTLIYWVKM